MSLPVSASDIWTLLIIVRETYSKWSHAPEEHSRVKELLRYVDGTLSQLHILVDLKQVPVEDGAQPFRGLLQACEKTTRSLATIAEKYELSGKSRSRPWRRIRFGGKKEDIMRLQGELNVQVSLLNAFLSARMTSAQQSQGRDIGQVLHYIRRIYERDTGANHEAASIYSRWTRHSGDSLKDWRALRRDLVAGGFSGDFVNAHKHRISRHLTNLLHERNSHMQLPVTKGNSTLYQYAPRRSFFMRTTPLDERLRFLAPHVNSMGFLEIAGSETRSSSALPPEPILGSNATENLSKSTAPLQIITDPSGQYCHLHRGQSHTDVPLNLRTLSELLDWPEMTMRFQHYFAALELGSSIEVVISFDSRNLRFFWNACAPLFPKNLFTHLRHELRQLILDCHHQLRNKYANVSITQRSIIFRGASENYFDQAWKSYRSLSFYDPSSVICGLVCGNYYISLAAVPSPSLTSIEDFSFIILAKCVKIFRRPDGYVKDLKIIEQAPLFNWDCSVDPLFSKHRQFTRLSL